MNSYNVGTSIKIKGSFIDNETGMAVDPDSVHIEIEYPGNRHVVYTYGIDPEVKRLDTGIYYMDIVGGFGYHGYRVYSDAGVIAASDESEFFVK